MLLHLVLLASAAADMSPKIVGGGEADIGDWPFMAFVAIIGADAAATCGGSLISSQTVLTAAHCLDDITDSKRYFDQFKYSIMMGHAKFQKAKMVREVIDYQTHQNYNPIATAFDIGIMFLAKPVIFSRTVKKVLLMKKINYKRDRLMEVAGWGAWSLDASSNSPELKSLPQTLIPAKKCQALTRSDDSPSQEGVICGGAINATEFAYSGDSGGPIIKAGTQIQMGLVSYRAENYGITVYTSISYYYNWIEDTQNRLYMTHCMKHKMAMHRPYPKLAPKLASKAVLGGVTFSDYDDK